MPAAEWFGAAISPANVRNAVATSSIVGPILTVINQGDVILAGGDPQMLKLALTFLVPYCVATVAGANACLRGNVCDVPLRPDEPECQDAAALVPEIRPGSVGAMATADGVEPAQAFAVSLDHIVEATRVTTEIRDNAVQVNQRSNARKRFLEELTALSQSVADEVAKIEEMAGEGRQALSDIRDSVSSISEHVDAIASRNEQGTGLVREVDEAVRRFNAEFSEIERMSQRIAEIAEKTNLLALNATIEAARAGEAGRGFAVVAQEVKQLATTSGTSAEEIKRLLASLSQSAGEVGDKIAALSTELEEATSDSRGSKDAVAEISERVTEAVGTTDRTAAQASHQLGDFRAVIERLGSLQDDTEKAIAGSATNIDLATKVLDNLAAARRSIDPDDTAEVTEVRQATHA